LFLPALGVSHVEAEATSLLAAVPMSLLGSRRQRRCGIDFALLLLNVACLRITWDGSCE
jgi:uncharacterized membrane protein YfcA